MYRLSNKVIGVLNLIALLVSIPIIGGGLYMSRKGTTCGNFIQTPLLALGFIVLLVSLAGFIGACCHIARALWVYLVVMLLLIVALMIITVFGFVVTGQGGGASVPGRVYKEYHLQEYSNWLRSRIKEAKNWNSIKGCIMVSKSCDKVAPWTPFDYLRNDMSPIQSGCCKPPTSCTYDQQPVKKGQDPDCYKWSNNPSILCFSCDSCKAGLLESVRRNSHKLSVLNVVILILLIFVYSLGCCAFQNTRRDDPSYHMSKFRPRWGFY